MTTWYVQTVAPITDGSSASWGDQESSGDGSSSSPYGSIQELQANETLANGDIIELDTVTNDVPHYGPVTIDGVDNITVRRDPSVSGWQRMVNGFPIDLSTVHATGGTYDVYKTSAGGATSVPNRVSQNWNSNTNGVGHRYGILTSQASAAACASTYGFYYDSGTDTLYVSIPSGADINDYEHIVGRAGHTLLINSCDNATVGKGISVEHALSTSGTEGYGIRFDTDSVGGLIIGCQADGCRWHSLGSVANDPTGFKMLGNTCRTLTVGGDGHMVIYAADTGEVIADNVMAGNTLYLDSWLGHDQNPIDTTGGVGGFKCHTASDAGDASPGALIIRNNTTIWSGDNAAHYHPDFAFNAPNAKLGGRPSDITDPSDFGIQMYDNNFGGHGGQVGGGDNNETWVASVRDQYNIDASSMTAATGSGGVIGCSAGASSDNGLAMFSCTVSADLYKVSAKRIISPWGGGEVHLEGTSVHLRGTGHHSATALLMFNNSVAGFSTNGNIFSCEQASGIRLALGNWAGAMPDSSAKTAAWNNNWYDPKFNSAFNSTTGDTRSDFETTYDTTGEYDDTPAYDDDETLELTSGAQATTTSKSSGPVGINAREFSDQYGAWQYGADASLTIDNTTPADDATGVADTQVLAIEFSDEVAYNVGSALIEVYQSGSVVASDAVNSGTINASDKTQYSLAGLLSGLTGAVSVHISPYAFKTLSDEIAFDGIEDDTTLNFTINLNNGGNRSRTRDGQRLR